MKRYEHGNAVICVVRPELSEAERVKRENQILIALQQFGRAKGANTNEARC